MATLNCSSEGPAISRSYQSIVDSSLPTGGAASSPTYGQWVLYSVAAPLASAFQQDSGKESVLKVQTTGAGELVDLIDDFSDGRIQFAFVKVKDPNTTLGKSVLIAWCGEGVPERTKGYFGSHLTVVSKLLHGYHVQVTARADSDLTPEGIIQKVADASGSKYSGATTSIPTSTGPTPPMASKPAFQPTRVKVVPEGFNPLGSRARGGAPAANEDDDGWGQDAPQVNRSQLEKVASAYKPTKVNMSELMSQKQEPSRFSAPTSSSSNGSGDLVKGGYQPIGKVDIAAIRRQAQESGTLKDDRPAPVKGNYEPIGKVDIAAIRAKAQGGDNALPKAPLPSNTTEDAPKSLADRSAAFSNSERLTTLPKPKPANKFGSNQSSFTGTKAPTPSGFDVPSIVAKPLVGSASKTFADEGGKTPAQIWAEKKRERGLSGAADTTKPASTPIVSQTSGGGEWQSGYTGKKWGSVQTTKVGQSATGDNNQVTGDEETQEEPTTNISSIKDRFSQMAPDNNAPSPTPPPMDLSSKPNAGGPRGVPMPGLPTRPIASQVSEEEPSRLPTPPAQPPRSPSPPTPPVVPGSPIRVAMPVGRGDALEAPEELSPAAPLPVRSLEQSLARHQDLDEEEDHDLARAAATATAETSFGAQAVASAPGGPASAGRRALVLYDYNKDDDDEIELREDEYVTSIQMVDDDWWRGVNTRGEEGLFPSGYVKLEEEGPPQASASAPPPVPVEEAEEKSEGKTATAQHDYDALEPNELSFPEGAKITGVEFPDDDWWSGYYNGTQGYFPANHVELDA